MDVREGTSSSSSNSNNDAIICIICSKPINDDKIHEVKEKGIARFIESSKARKDDKHLIMKNLSSFIIHNTCYCTYNRDSSIKAAKKQAKEDLANIRKKYAQYRSFDYSKLCFLCEDSVDDKSDIARTVKQIETLTNIVETVERKTENEKEKYKFLVYRIKQIKDVDRKSVVYHSTCLTSFYQYRTSTTQGRPISEDMSEALTFIISHILQDEERCQFSLKEILSDFKGNVPDFRYLIKSLENHFGNEIKIYSTRKDYFICFRNSEGKIIDDDWYKNRSNVYEEERLRVVKQAAHIILQDIRLQQCDLQTYKVPTSVGDNIFSPLPPTLEEFVKIVVLTHKQSTKEDNLKKWINRAATIGHILMSAARPRAFISQILLGLSVLIHRKFASKDLINILSNIGLCESYKETLRFECSIMKDPQNFAINEDSFVQFIWDNADHNSKTIDGTGTFHSMGGIICVTPSSAVITKQQLLRLPKIPQASDTGEFGFLPLLFCDKNATKLNRVIVEKLPDLDESLHIDNMDFLWLFSKARNPTTTEGWLGFMQSRSYPSEFFVSKVIPLPFINASASDENTILTALAESAARCKANKQTTAFVTFDQPLYWKARGIISNIDANNDTLNLSSVVIRLGGFHALMSFIGSIGYIMEGSGLKEVFSTIYAELSIEKILNGHAFSRAIRGHLLIQSALGNFILDNCALTDSDKEFLSNTLEEIKNTEYDKNFKSSTFLEIKKKFIDALSTLKENGPTAQLWLQYFEMVNIIKQFYNAERSGNWRSHLISMQRMIPYFHATGHFLYAKSCHLYLQDMNRLPEIMDMMEYDYFCNKGWFTIRRSNKFWCGVWSDMTIEQVLMRSIKLVGGFTHGRGITDSVVAKWIAGSVISFEICNEMEKFCMANLQTSEQHVECRPSRIRRDAMDLTKIIEFFIQHNPFQKSYFVTSIVSGVVGNDKINCHKAFEVGQSIQNNLTGLNFNDIKSKKKDKVCNLFSMNSKVNINNQTICVNPLLIFQRICASIQDRTDMKKKLKFELAPYPLSLFNEGGMRKSQKHVFCSLFDEIPALPSDKDILHVIDGGFLLQHFLWGSNTKVCDILLGYVSYVQRYFIKNSVIVFDGYGVLGTKSFERLRRRNEISLGQEIMLDFNINISIKQKEFLRVDRNKEQLIALLCPELNKAGYRTKVADEDADVLIVQTALEEYKNEENTIVIVGNDTDLLVILTQLSTENMNIYFEKKQEKSKSTLYGCNSFKHSNIRKYAAFLYIFSGCDTTSCFFNQGKFKLLNANQEVLQLIDIFFNCNAAIDDITKNGCELIVALYSNAVDKHKKKDNLSLDNLRYLHFIRNISKKSFKLESLPPTQGAGKQHVLRVYYQLQSWLGNELDPTKYGWKKTDNGFEPVFTTDNLIPEDIITHISCKCTTGCKSSRCSCKKYGLHCTVLCLNCNDDEQNICYNRAAILVDENEDENDEVNELFEEMANNDGVIEHAAKKCKV